ncbi:(2Fe-2S)-binding protein [Pseudolysobacter antarcticus]|uniref:(2Fe-2S)-binding protein n=1 Tax=Pseudolysobacter antarcticus TaxID=2511995 RepID=A0A411HH91_9GAMM|nr:(2Fe-2S)-binding protein [Pseudolysobacter antarcticus]QBB69841.1 (2Fe-2S)-binding protein [Pseudolysobacter antarcticus]
MRSPEYIEIFIDGRAYLLIRNSTVAAALLNAGITHWRRSVSGQPRAALCGMGVCFECRVNIDGHAHQRACQVLCTPGMRVITHVE